MNLGEWKREGHIDAVKKPIEVIGTICSENLKVAENLTEHLADVPSQETALLLRDFTARLGHECTASRRDKRWFTNSVPRESNFRGGGTIYAKNIIT